MISSRLLLLFLAGTVAGLSGATLTVGDTFLGIVQIQAFGPLGESFTVPGTPVQSLGFRLNSLNPTEPVGSLTLTIRAGDGINGSIIGTQILTPAAGTNGYFDFPVDSYSFTAGQMYTGLLTSNTIYWGLYVGSDVYSGGKAYSRVPLPIPEPNDVAFRLTYTAIPEPGSLLLVAAGIVTIAIRTVQSYTCASPVPWRGKS